MNISVVIGRFQVPYLHAGHKDLLRTAAEKSDNKSVVVLVGTTKETGTKRNPLDFKTRELMIRSDAPTSFKISVSDILPLPDLPTDEEWSQNVDRVLESLYTGVTFTLYGSRDSFASHYSGKYKVVEIPVVNECSGTELREAVAHSAMDSYDFRRGMIYAAYMKGDIDLTGCNASEKISVLPTYGISIPSST